MDDRAPTINFEDDETAALTVGAGGVLALVLGRILDSGLLRLLGLVAVAAGGGLYARARLTERTEKIETAEGHIRSELDELDPVARAQVMKDLADSDR
jgi:HAMP domain-containing protein